MIFALTVPSPVGPLRVFEENGAITRVTWAAKVGEAGNETPLLLCARDQIAQYFDDPSVPFDLRIHVEGSPFLRTLCAAMSAIPCGETRSYGDLARALGVSPQAVGQGCGANPVPVLIPCHRVLGANGLGGYSGAGGIETKVWLLKHEGAASLLI